MISYYLDTSAVIRWILQSPNYYSEFGNWDTAVSSVLLKTEYHRAMDRLLKRGFVEGEQVNKYNQYFKEMCSFINWVKIDDRILEKACQVYQYPIGTLDAIHLVTAYLYQDEFEVGEYFFLTHDSELVKVATSIGLKVKGQ